MTSPPSPPDRRRLLIVVTIVVLVVGVGWWLWPRGDPRFVGAWAVEINGVPSNVRMFLNRSGKGATRTPSGAIVHYRWFVEDGKLAIGRQTTGWLQALVRSVEHAAKDFGINVLLEYEAMDIVSITNDTLTLRASDDQQFVLHRLSE